MLIIIDNYISVKAIFYIEISGKIDTEIGVNEFVNRF